MATRAITDSHAVAAIYEQPLRARDRRGALRRRAARATHGSDVLERLGLEPRRYVLFVGRLEPENNPHLLVEAWARIPSERTQGHEARGGGRRALRVRVHQPGAPRGRPAGGVPGLRVRPRLLGAAAQRLPVLRADRGRRHAPGDPRVAGGGQLRAGQRLPAQRRDRGRRRACTSRAPRACPTWPASSSGCWPSPSSWPATARRRCERAELYSWDAVAAAYEQLLLEVSESTGHGPLPMEQARRARARHRPGDRVAAPAA